MKNPADFTPQEFLTLHAASAVRDRLRRAYRDYATGSPLLLGDILSLLAVAGATLSELVDELERTPDVAPLTLESPAPAPAPASAKCRHKWGPNDGDHAPVCRLCGATKSPQGRPKGSPSTTVADVTKFAPQSESLPLMPSARVGAREPLPPPHIEPFVTPPRGGRS